MVYANNLYLLDNNIDIITNELTFDGMERYKIKYDEVKYNLLKNDKYIIDTQTDSGWFRSYFYFIKNKNFIIHVCDNITDFQTLISSLRKEAMFFKQTNEGIMVTDENAIIESVNTAFCRATEYTKDESIGRPASILSSGMHGADFYEHMWDSLIVKNSWSGEIWNRRKNGEIYPEYLSITKSIDSNGKVNYLALFTDLSYLKESDNKVKFYATHDPLTGLMNKVQFTNMLKHIIETSKRHSRVFALMFLDLDHFKEVNDTYGHSVGDSLLKIVASKFRKALRKEDVLARIGGDEFNIIAENINNYDGVLAIANKLIKELKDPIMIDGNQCVVGLSIGISVFPKHGDNIDDLVNNADAAMYDVKNKGRNGVIVYESSLTDKLKERVYLSNEIKKAVKTSEFKVYFQPFFNKELRMVGAEAYARWKHPTYGYISPDVFIKIAEKNGSIFEFGQIVLKKALQSMKDIQEYVDDSFVFSINSSSKEFLYKDYIKNVYETVIDFGINPKKL